MYLIWFREDLRLTDNPALNAAIEQANDENCPLLALYINCPEQDKQHHRAEAQSKFIRAHIADLASRLEHLNIQLIIKRVPLYADVPAVFDNLIEKYSIQSVFFNRNYLFNENQRDRQVADALKENQVAVHISEPAYLLPPKSIEKKAGGMYHVFTPYKKQFIQALKDRHQAPLGMPEKMKCAYTNEEIKMDLENQWQHDWWPVGEKNARQRLTEFLDQEQYDKQRDYPAIKGTSRLSPYLAIGVISARQCLAQALKENGESAFESTWVSELIWRDFYHDLVAYYPRLVKGETFKDDAMDQWQYDEKMVNAWKSGQTGFPIIDAGMRQLKKEHWMHNRIRMLTASFFSKLCLHDWRIGERHFMEHLLDGDFASNNGGWQWSSATGCDAAPYFRIFNPTSQSRQYDENADYIRHYVPELADLSDKDIHEPTQKQRSECDYPEPIIDYKQARQQALDWFKSG